MEAHHLIKDTLAASWRANQWMEVLFGGLATCAIIHVIQKALDGQSSNFWEAIGFSLKKWFTLILAAFLLNLITVIGFILLVIPGVLMSVRGVFMISYIVDQNQSARDSIDSSWQLAKGHFWRILGYSLVVAAGALLPMTVLMFTVGITQAYLEEVIESEMVIDQFWLLDWIAESLGSITFAFLPVFYFIFYRGLRSIKSKSVTNQYFKS
jgi:membrane-anchored glycerophosphoryl diester phosphodiesterase (GDPDase)